ncbi:MAG: hydroxyacid dehydrogenase [Acidobacteria bacterium]|nr:MAG: hydroxyacid dehydrogenase [Acidobacteriota bacterium]
MKIAFFELEDWELEALRKTRFEGHTLELSAEPMSARGLARDGDADVVSTFIHSTLDRATLERLPKLKFIATRSTGFDHIDLAFCRERGIPVANVPSYGENTVAEHTFALILALSRNIHKAFVHTLARDIPFQALRGFDLAGKTLGVVGAGRIGLHAIKIAKGFGMQVVAFDLRRESLLAEVLNFRYVSLDELLAASDIISLHCPYTPRTHHLLNLENIRKVKRGALLVNTARGGLVDPAALTQALDEGILAGAALDVLEGEELLKDERQILEQPLAQDKLRMLLLNHSLLNRDNVVITPHIAFNSREAVERILSTTVENIRAFLAGSPQNVVSSS